MVEKLNVTPVNQSKDLNSCCAGVLACGPDRTETQHLHDVMGFTLLAFSHVVALKASIASLQSADRRRQSCMTV